jgi:regulator of protease activity HflC (stomatin/prohibitin superfamily)
MMEEQVAPVMSSDETQLSQERVPLDEAAGVFAVRDASGRIPIVVVPQRLSRIRNELVGLALLSLVAGPVLGALLDNVLILILGIVLSIPLLILGIYRSFMVRIPEGVSGLLAKGGRHLRDIGSGTHIIPPWIMVTHLVARREIPFDVPVVEALTSDDVRADVDILVTFAIADPYRFVYSISAFDFDHVFQAACQDGLRRMVRQITAAEVSDLTKDSLADLQAALGADAASYGVEVRRLSITYAQPQAEFLRSKEARQLASVQQAEEAEKQALAERRQAAQEALARQKVIAQVEREREQLQVAVQKAAVQRRVVELEAEAEALRLERLEERLKTFPLAVQYELEQARLAIARALAGNTRAMLQVGGADEIARAFMVGDVLRDAYADAGQTGGDGRDNEIQAPKLVPDPPPPTEPPAAPPGG